MWLNRLIFIFSLLQLSLNPIISHATPSECARILMDPRYGDFSQNDRALSQLGLISENGSLLCGPTCIANSMTKVRSVLNLNSPFTSPADEIKNLVESVQAEINPDANITQNGITLRDLMALIEKHLDSEGISAELALIGSGQLTQINWDAGMEDDQFVILKLGYYSVADPTAAPFSYEQHRFGGHLVILAGRSENDPNVIFVNDPGRGQRKLSLSGAVKFTDRTNTYQWVKAFSASLVEGSTLLESAVLVKFDGRFDGKFKDKIKPKFAPQFTPKPATQSVLTPSS